MKKVILSIIILIFLTGCGKDIITPPINNEIVYRALLIGIGDYVGSENDLPSPIYSVDRIHQIFSQCRFGLSDAEFFIINELKDSDATKKAILNEIVSTFSGADNNDVSYFYYTGHGGWLGTSYICPADYTIPIFSIFSLINVNALENALSAIPGTKVVILDTCHSGGFIGKSKEGITISEEELMSFNDEIINTFSQAQSKSLLTNNQYKVLTSCHYNQECDEIIPIFGKPCGVFTMALCAGCGYFNYNYPADINLDTEINLQEAYFYVKNWVQSYFIELQQDVQIYPVDSNYPIIEY